MEFYTTLWANDWAKQIQKNDMNSILSVIYGGPHSSQPSLGRIKVGDVIFPVRIESGKLYIMGRMTVERIMNADEYLQSIGIHTDCLWDSYTYQHQDTITHKIPRTCADNVAIGINGTIIKDRLVPTEKLALIKLGIKKGEEQPLKPKLSLSFQGHIRRLSENSAMLFNQIIEQNI